MWRAFALLSSSWSWLAHSAQAVLSHDFLQWQSSPHFLQTCGPGVWAQQAASLLVNCCNCCASRGAEHQPLCSGKEGWGGCSAITKFGSIAFSMLIMQNTVYGSSEQPSTSLFLKSQLSSRWQFTKHLPGSFHLPVPCQQLAGFGKQGCLACLTRPCGMLHAVGRRQEQVRARSPLRAPWSSHGAPVGCSPAALRGHKPTHSSRKTRQGGAAVSPLLRCVFPSVSSLTAE